EKDQATAEQQLDEARNQQIGLREQLEDERRDRARQIEGLEYESRLGRWRAYEVAEVLRLAVAKYGRVQSPPCTAVLDVHRIMKMHEDDASSWAEFWSVKPQPGDSVDSFKQRLSAALAHIGRRRIIWEATGATTLSASVAMLPFTSEEFAEGQKEY